MSLSGLPIPSGTAQLLGMWRRSLFVGPDGVHDSTTSVHWLQGPCMFADLRQPPSLPLLRGLRGAGVRGLAHLSLEDCAALAIQEGFAGRLSHEGRWFEWQRLIDFQPQSAHPDAGSLHWEGGLLVERGRDLPYLEHWELDRTSGTAPAGALTLRDRDRHTLCMLVRVGSWFMFARDRAVQAPRGTTLSACIGAVRSLSEAQVLIDCELSLGRVTASGFRITTSTLPFRIGDALDPRLAPDGLTTRDRDREGQPIQRRWSVTAREGSLPALLMPAD